MQDRTTIFREDISSPTVAMPLLFLLVAIAAMEHRIVTTVDIQGAYLNAIISQYHILMELDPTVAQLMIQLDPTYKNFLRPNGTIIVELEKALYGCIQSGKLWYDRLTKVLIDDGFIVNIIDKCVFNKCVNDVQVTVCIYVDDIIITSSSQDLVTAVEDLFKNTFKNITVNTGMLHHYLGMSWDFQVPGEVKISMEAFIQDLLQPFAINKAVITPATDRLFDIREAPLLPAKEKELFHSVVAKLLYLSKRVRPDLLLSVSFLTTRVQKPDIDDFNKLQRVLMYLYGTPDLGLVLRPGLNPILSASIDASYGVHPDGRSHSGMSVSFGSGSILAQSTKQKINVKSSTEAELIALSDKSSMVIWTKDFLESQGITVGAANVYQDNVSTITLIEKGASTSDRTRHINIRYFWVKDRIVNGDIKVIHQSTQDMIADVLTKPLQGKQFLALRDQLLNWKI
jgi:hypothetical protein